MTPGETLFWNFLENINSFYFESVDIMGGIIKGWSSYVISEQKQCTASVNIALGMGGSNISKYSWIFGFVIYEQRSLNPM